VVLPTTGDSGRKSHNTSKCHQRLVCHRGSLSGACFVDDRDVNTFEQSKNILECIIGRIGRGKGQHDFPVDQDRDVPGPL
jgi:hypothetical protein